MANKLRGEVAIIIGEKSYIMRPTFDALCNIENRIDKSLITLLCDFDNKGIKLTEQQIIIEEGIRAAHSNLPSDIGEQLMQENINDTLSSVVQFLQQGLNL